MSNKILTLDNLYQFFVKQNKDFSFNVKDDCPIVVSVPGNFEEIKDDMQGMLKLKLKVCHTLLNRNKSFISEENMRKAMPTLKYRPILAYIHQLPDGTWDFYAHNVEITESENGDEQINYLEKQVGCFTTDEPYLEYDEEKDKTYVIAYAVIPEEYTKADEIIRRKNGTKVSCELVIEDLQYNAKEKYLELNDFYFSGCTLLGCDDEGNEIAEGMAGSRADIADFCHKKPTLNYQDKLIETLERLNFTLDSFNNINIIKEGGSEDMGNFENEVVEEIVEPTTDEDVVEEKTFDEEEVVVEEEEEETPAPEDNGEEKFSKTFTVELSHEDIRCALYNLIAIYEEEDNEWYSIHTVYDEYFIMQGWINGKFFKQGYSVDEENISLEGDRQEVFQMLLTESEKITIEQLRSNYAALEEQYNELKAFKDSYDAAQVKAQKDAIFAKEEYECLKDNESFKQLVKEAEKYSVDEVSVKADLIFAAHVKATGEFSAKKEEEPKAMHFSINSVDEVNKKPYGSLFD